MSSQTQRAVLITGCSSGIGRETALHLAREGYLVFAGVRRQEDAEALGREARGDPVPVVPLDLRCSEHIQGARETVEAALAARGIRGLYALVNNAGGGCIAPLELMDIDLLRAEAETRIVGPVALLQAMLPLLRQGNGRVLWVQTPGLLPIAFDASIHACDFAANCLARTLRQELAPWGIPSVQIRCGTIATPSVEKSYQQLHTAMAQWEAQGKGLYNAALEKTERSFRAMDAKRTPAADVAALIGRALCAERPRMRYHVGRMSGISAVFECLPHPLADRMLAGR